MGRWIFQKKEEKKQEKTGDETNVEGRKEETKM